MNLDKEINVAQQCLYISQKSKERLMFLGTSYANVTKKIFQFATTLWFGDASSPESFQQFAGTICSFKGQIFYYTRKRTHRITWGAFAWFHMSQYLPDLFCKITHTSHSVGKVSEMCKHISLSLDAEPCLSVLSVSCLGC